MSEASESLQVRTDDADACIARLRESGFNGFAFRGDRGWLTVVPYGDPASEPMLPDGAAASLAAALGAPVISYSCHNDFGWGFVLALPDGRSTGFTYLDNPFGDFGDEAGASNGADDAALDEAILAAVVPVERVRPFLGPPYAALDGSMCRKAQRLRQVAAPLCARPAAAEYCPQPSPGTAPAAAPLPALSGDFGRTSHPFP